MITINSAKLILNFTKDGQKYTIEQELTNFQDVTIKIPPKNIDKNNEFIKRAKEVHGNKYDYSKVNYINNRTKVIITCPIHGDFEQVPYSHLNGHGCAKCSAIERGSKSRITLDKFIEICNKKFNNKYDYSKVKFNSPLDKITIICPIHGEFKQTVHDHLYNSKYGCPKCGREHGKLLQQDSIQDFINKANQVHNFKYNYSKSIYNGSKNKIEIICPIHGSFWQIPNSHLCGKGCPKCGYENNSYSKEEWIEKVSYFHNNKYNYSKVNYVNWETPVTIICPKHGEFQQTPHSHTRYGCPLCNSSKGESIIQFYLDKNNIHYIYQYKINIDNNINSSGYAYIDFYLPDYNLFIEYNGKQHYVPIEYFGGEINFNRQYMRDNYIRNYCKNNNIRLLEIPYTENNIQECIINYINNIND